MSPETMTFLLEEAKNCSPDRLPDFLGKLETVRVTAMARLAVPASPVPTDEFDRWLTIDEAMQMLGFSKSYLYTKSFPFKRREGRSIRFSRAGILEYIQKRRN